MSLPKDSSETVSSTKVSVPKAPKAPKAAAKEGESSPPSDLLNKITTLTAGVASLLAYDNRSEISDIKDALAFNRQNVIAKANLHVTANRLGSFFGLGVAPTALALVAETLAKNTMNTLVAPLGATCALTLPLQADSTAGDTISVIVSTVLPAQILTIAAPGNFALGSIVKHTRNANAAAGAVVNGVVGTIVVHATGEVNRLNLTAAALAQPGSEFLCYYNGTQWAIQATIQSVAASTAITFAFV